MAENDITMQQKRKRSLAAMERINGILERQKKKALVNAEISQQKLKEMYQAENRKSWIHFGLKLILNVLAMVFLKADRHFMNFGKESPNQELKNMSEKFVSKVSNGYADVFSLMDGITDKVKKSDEAADQCYIFLSAVASNKQSAESAILSMGEVMGVFIRASVREFMIALGKEADLLSEIRNCVNDTIYPAE